MHIAITRESCSIRILQCRENLRLKIVVLMSILQTGSATDVEIEDLEESKSLNAGNTGRLAADPLAGMTYDQAATATEQVQALKLDASELRTLVPQVRARRRI